jgi:LysM repeat protein
MLLAIGAPAFAGAERPSGAANPLSWTVLGHHTVRRGETLYCIARAYHVDPIAIARQNRLVNPSLLHVGQVLAIPNVPRALPAGPTCARQFGTTGTPEPPAPGCKTYYTVVRGDTLYRIALRYRVTIYAIVQANGIANPNYIRVGQVLCIPGSGTAPPPAPTATPPPGATPTPTTVPSTGFGYGIAAQALINTDYTVEQVSSLGLGWLKQQVRWGDMEGTRGQISWSGLDAVVNAANAKGLNLMLSVVDAPDWSRSYFDSDPEGAPPDDYGLLAEFLGKLADRYEGKVQAIEVWNEQNLGREWDTEAGVNAAAYVQLLKVSYQAIKAQDPNIIVVSGALSPTGGEGIDPNRPGRVVFLDDFVYFQRMVNAGFLNYCDCVGAHHNGYNWAPDIAWNAGYNDPTATFRGPFDNPHHSWSFRSTLWGYRDMVAAAGSNKKLCVTEFGYASAEGLGGYPPGFEFAQDNTLQEQAQWDVQAFQLMRQWGFVRMAMLWNLDYSQKGTGPQDPNAPYALIDFDGKARPAFNAIRDMAKP